MSRLLGFLYYCRPRTDGRLRSLLNKRQAAREYDRWATTKTTTPRLSISYFITDNTISERAHLINTFRHDKDLDHSGLCTYILLTILLDCSMRPAEHDSNNLYIYTYILQIIPSVDVLFLLLFRLSSVVSRTHASADWFFSSGENCERRRNNFTSAP